MRNVILITLLSSATAHAGLSRLEALGMIESGDNDAAIGRAGEVSRYQIQPRIWHQYSSSQDYRDCRTSRQVAEQHLAELGRIFSKCARRELSDFDVYVLWNAGPTYYGRIGWTPARVHPVVRERATRYVNLCEWNGTARAIPSGPAAPVPPASWAAPPVASVASAKPAATVTVTAAAASERTAGNSGASAPTPNNLVAPRNQTFALDATR